MLFKEKIRTCEHVDYNIRAISLNVDNNDCQTVAEACIFIIILIYDYMF